MSKWFWSVLLLLSVHPAMAAESVLVFGGTGRLGAAVVTDLVNQGYAVTVLARPDSSHARLAGLEIDVITGDLMDGDSLLVAVAGRPYRFVVDASAGQLGQAGFYSNAMKNILAAIADSQVQQFILHGSVGAGDNVRNFPDIPFGRMLDTLRDKGEAEAMLIASGIPYTIIRNGRILPDGTAASGKAELTTDDTELASITRADLALLTLQCLGNSACLNQTYHAIDNSRR